MRNVRRGGCGEDEKRLQVLGDTKYWYDVLFNLSHANTISYTALSVGDI